MRVFFIPSWYPSSNSPLTGIFFRDQAEAITTLYSEVQVGVSIWGQNDEQLLLWGNKPLQNIRKLWRKPLPTVHQEKENLTTFFTPTFTWTRKFWGGNLAQIIAANRLNLQNMQAMKGKVAVIHAHVGFPAGYIARAISQETHIPYIITEQMSPFPFPYFLRAGKLMPKLQLAYQDARQNIAISPSLQKAMHLQGVPRLAYIPNLIDERMFIPKPPLYEAFTFFMLGRMVEQKGIPILLHAIAIIAAQYPHVQVRLGGGGEGELAYQALAAQLQITSHLTWLGELSREEALQEFQNCHAFVLPSLHETMGVVLAEALACGKPLVSTYCGGAESVVTPENGLLAKVNDVNDLAEKLACMIYNHAQYKPTVLRQDACTRFSRKVIVDKLLEVYNM